MPEHTLRHIESLVNHLHAKNNSEMSNDDRIGVLHLPSPFHEQSCMQSVGGGEQSQGVSTGGVFARMTITSLMMMRRADGMEQTSESLHRVTVIGRGRIPEVFLADRVFRHGASQREDRGEG